MAEILYIFWIAEKIQNHMKLIFLTSEKREERKVKMGEIACQNNSRAGNRATKGSAKCRPIVLWEKNQTFEK